MQNRKESGKSVVNKSRPCLWRQHYFYNWVKDVEIFFIYLYSNYIQSSHVDSNRSGIWYTCHK